MKYPVRDLRFQAGSALVVVLLVLAVGMALVVPMYREHVLFIKRVGNSFIAEQGYAYLRGGEELAGLVLALDVKEDEEEQVIRDDLGENWAQEITPYALDEGGWLTGRLEDLQGRFNLNALAGAPPEGQRFTPAQEQFIRLLQTLESAVLDESTALLITESVVDWLDADSNARRLGAEDDYYAGSDPPYRVANRAMQSVSELLAIANMTAEIYRELEPLVTVWPEDGKINIHTASAEVLRTINSAGDLAPLSISDGETLLELRGETGFENKQAMLESQVFADRQLAAPMLATLVESSNYFLFSGEAEVADRVTRLYSVLRRKGQQTETLVRASGSL